MAALLLLVALTAPTEIPADCLVADKHLYVSADIERFPAIGSGEIDWTTAQKISKDGGTYFEILVDRCSKRPASLMKYQSGNPVYGYYYRYKDGRLVALDLRYMDGEPTAREFLDRI